jgi:predicted nucleic acid-binding Zn ribbon protein
MRTERSYQTAEVLVKCAPMAFDRLSDILKLLQKRNPALKLRMAEAEAVSRFEKAVGPGIAKHARAVAVRQGTLLVEVTHPIWRSELHHRKRQILAVMNEKGAETIQDIAFVDPRPGRQDDQNTR